MGLDNLTRCVIRHDSVSFMNVKPASLLRCLDVSKLIGAQKMLRVVRFRSAERDKVNELSHSPCVSVLCRLSILGYGCSYSGLIFQRRRELSWQSGGLAKGA